MNEIINQEKVQDTIPDNEHHAESNKSEQKHQEPKKEIKIIAIEEYEELKRKEKELEETIDLLKRTRADYLNYIKMARNQQEATKEYALVDFFRKIIPYLAMCDTALEHCRNTDNIKSIQEGIELIINEFKKILATEGLQEIDPCGQIFDPYISEAIEMVETENKDENNIVAETVSKGYKLKDVVVCPAKVKIKKLKE